MFAIFDTITKNMIRQQEDNEVKENEIALEIGKDIKWKCRIRRNGEFLDIPKEEKLEGDIIIRGKEKNGLIRILRGGTSLLVDSDKININGNNDVIEYGFLKEEIQIDENNNFKLKPDDVLIQEYKDKIIDEYINKIPQKYIIDGTAKTKIDNIQIEIDKIATKEEIKLFYNKVLVEAIK